MIPQHLRRHSKRLLSTHSNFNIQGTFRNGRAAYLDLSATTPMDPRVLDRMLPYMISSYGNPHSRTHSYGWEAEQSVELARESVADLIGASTSKEIIFTSGATESNNIAVKGVAKFYKGKKRHVITTQTEHKCVLDSCRALEMEGFDGTFVLYLFGWIFVKKNIVFLLVVSQNERFRFLSLNGVFIFIFYINIFIQ